MIDMNKLSGEIVDLMSKMVNLNIHFEVRLEDEEERELVEALFYDMLDVKIEAGRKIRDMKVAVDIEPELLECEEVATMLLKAEENYDVICDIYNALPVTLIDNLIN